MHGAGGYTGSARASTRCASSARPEWPGPRGNALRPRRASSSRLRDWWKRVAARVRGTSPPPRACRGNGWTLASAFRRRRSPTRSRDLCLNAKFAVPVILIACEYLSRRFLITFIK
jgi:hypothetical protein